MGVSENGEGLRVREATDGDLEAVAEVFTRAEPNDPPLTVDVLRWLLGRAVPERPHAHLVAEENGVIMGSAILRALPDVEFLTVFLDVHPDYRGRGIGHALMEAVLARTEDEAELATTISAAYPEGVRFAERHGFVEHSRTFESTLDLGSLDAAGYEDVTQRLADEGYRLTSLAEADDPNVRRALHRLNNAARKDIPTTNTLLPLSYAEWERDWINAPHALPSAFAISLKAERVAAFSYIVSQSEGIGYMWMTAVGRPHRSKGLGLAVKVHALQAAKALGLSEVITNNDPDNAPMLAINRRLGFRDRPARIEYKKLLGR
jgi:GNAT superfamily N-acetyltransferase